MSQWLTKFVKTAKPLPSVSVMSVHNSGLLEKNKGDIETTDKVSNLLQRWKKKSAEI